MSAMRYALDVSNAICVRCQQCDMRSMSAMRYAFDVSNAICVSCVYAKGYECTECEEDAVY